jgi:hypothetical protein
MAQKKSLEQLTKDLKEYQELLQNAKTDKEKSEAKELIQSVSAEIEKAREEEEAKAEKEKEAEEAKAKKEAEEKAKKEAEAKKNKPSKGKIEEAKEELKIMDRYKVNEIYKNSKGEYFTNQNLAEMSEKDKKKVKTITREVVETIAK